MKFVNKLVIVFLTIVFIYSCGVPKDVMDRINSSSKEMKEFPIDYYMKFPSQNFETWNKDYDSYKKYLTSEIMKTQVSTKYTIDGVLNWWCFPSAQTHTQLDTSSIIKNKKLLEGDWRIISNRKINFTDSVDIPNNFFFRNEKLIYDEKDADLFITFSDSKLKMYGNEKKNKKYKVTSKNYKLINGRFLMLYGISQTTGSISQIGIDKDGQLIINSYSVQQKELFEKYMTFESTVFQTIYKKQ